jgi:RNA polymerase sigma factor (sigma-70 family)
VLVYRVCWRVLERDQDAEDAFQATFLLLAQKLPTVRNHDSLASWLHVAHRVALKARAETATRRCREQSAVRKDATAEDATLREVLAVLDAELAKLPEKWRLPLVLCYLEGRTQDEAADQLRWSKNTLRRRLDEARAALGRRLGQKGVGWPVTLATVLVADCTRETGNKHSEGEISFNLARTLDALDRRNEAIPLAVHALGIFQSVESPHADAVRRVLAQWTG